MNTGFWNGKRVFVTGHTGFKGSWLCLWLERLGAVVRGYALEPPTEPSLFGVCGVARGMDSRRGDVRDAAALRDCLLEFGPEVVIHMAAQSLVRESYRSSHWTFETNVMGTVNLLEAVRCAGGVRVVLVVTTDKCYDNREWLWGYRENDPLGGHDPYSSSKACAELVTAAYRKCFFEAGLHGAPQVAVASVRAGNVVGGGDWAPERLVPDVMRALLAGEPAVIRAPGAVRPWQHVLEPLGGYLTLAEAMWREPVGFAGAWNFGPAAGDAWPVGRVVDRLVGLWGGGARWRSAPDETAHEAHMLRLEISKARMLLGWTPKLPLDDALAWVVEWYKGHAGGADMRGLSLGMIGRFEQLAAGAAAGCGPQ